MQLHGFPNSGRHGAELSLPKPAPALHLFIPVRQHRSVNPLIPPSSCRDTLDPELDSLGQTQGASATPVNMAAPRQRLMMSIHGVYHEAIRFVKNSGQIVRGLRSMTQELLPRLHGAGLIATNPARLTGDGLSIRQGYLSHALLGDRYPPLRIALAGNASDRSRWQFYAIHR